MGTSAFLPFCAVIQQRLFQKLAHMLRKQLSYKFLVAHVYGF